MHLESFVKVKDYPELKSSLIQTLEDYRDVIALPGEPLGVTDKAEHHIRLKPNTKPVFINAYRLPYSQRETVQSAVEDMLQQGVIQESFSPWNSPLSLVPKKDGSFRPVIDFRRVNEVTVDNHYPLPVLGDLLMSLGLGNKIFSILNVLSGYRQLPMASESREFTTFSTREGHFEFLRMPFGLKSAPLTYQRTMNSIFSGMLGKSVFIYLDDILITNTDTKSHLDTIKLVLQRLKESGLKV